MAKDEHVGESQNSSITTKARYWVAVGYLENMREDWQAVIGEVLQLPYAYCVHDKDVEKTGDPRKSHVHIMAAWPGPTTYKAALAAFRLLNAPQHEAFPTAFKVQNVRYMYAYLIHDTDDARKKKKHLYAVTERITGNNFDIGAYEQLDAADRRKMRAELAQLIQDKAYTNYLDFYLEIAKNWNAEYEDIVVSYSSHFTRLINGMWQKLQDS
ncbi:MAG: hypothetical protein J6E31_07970 [Pyramidobacter sp.]|nr:hypothetical protein [Pyramidobacter sp.]